MKKIGKNEGPMPWRNKEGVFPTPNGKWLVSVKSKNNGSPFTTLCQRDTKELAEKEYNDYLSKIPKQSYIRLLTYENAMKVIAFVESLNNYDDYANITSGGVSLKSTEENHPKIVEYLKSLNVRFEITDKHPEKVNQEIVSHLRNLDII